MSYRILVVDDSAIIRTAVRKNLAVSGLPLDEVFEAANGVEALRILAEKWIDVVFTDLNMPEMNGVELVDRMRQDDILMSIPIVVISSDQRQETVDEMAKRGVNTYIKKPFNPGDFKAIVDELLGHEVMDVGAPCDKGSSPT